MGSIEYGRGTSDMGTSEFAGHGTEVDQHVRMKEDWLQAEKRPVEACEVRLRMVARTEQQSIDVPVQREEVIIEPEPAKRAKPWRPERAGLDPCKTGAFPA